MPGRRVSDDVLKLADESLGGEGRRVVAEPPADFVSNHTVARHGADAGDRLTFALPQQLRAERSGNKDGRVYVIRFTAVDAQGAACSGVVSVGVPHNVKKAPVNSGQAFDSTKQPG